MCNPLGERELVPIEYGLVNRGRVFAVDETKLAFGQRPIFLGVPSGLQVQIRKAAFDLHVANVFPSDLGDFGVFNLGVFGIFHLQKSMPEAARERKGFFRLFFGLASFVPRLGWHRNC